MKLFVISIAVALLFCAVAPASIITYTTTLTGTTENPPTGSPGTGKVSVVVDTVANTLAVTASFSGLTSNTTASHIHCCTASPLTGDAGVATQVPAFANMPLGVTSGSFTQTLDLTALSSYNPAFVTANGGTAASAEAVLLNGISKGDSYFNIHTTNFPSGEIRGYLVTVSAIPEPTSLLLAGFGLVGLAVRRRFSSRA